MSAKISLLFATAASLLLAACTDNGALSTAPAAMAARKDASSDATVSADDVGPIVSALSTTVCADVRGGTASAPDPGAPLQAWHCHGGVNQQFALQPSGAVTAYGGALCLDVFGAQGRDGDPVVAWPCHGGTNQQWTYTSAGQLQTAINGKCLDLWGGQGENGAALVVWPCHGGTNQKWTVPAARAGAPAFPVSTSSVGSAALPRVYLNTAMPAVTGRTISVPAGGDLQAALDAAQPGDQVVLAAGATYTGNFVLPVKAGMTGSQWITVRSGGALPAEGTRVGPGNAAQMAKILTPNNFGPVIATVPGAQGWRITGVEITSAPGTTWNYSLVNFGSGGPDQTSAEDVPSRLVLDRSYVHESPSFNLRRCVTLNSASSAVIDSYLADCHSRDNDSQAILGWNGPGPYKIVNNHLEAGHEVVMFGGNDPAFSGVVSSDIEMRHNHITRPLSWKGVWQVKNLLELKAAQRVLVEGNVFENNWSDAQNGFAFLWWSANQDGRCTWCVTQDVTFRYNRISNVAQGFSLAVSSVNPALPARRITIANNVITGVDTAGGRLYQVNGAIAGITIVNNSGLGGGQDIYFVTPDKALPTFIYKNNVTGGAYTLWGDGGYTGTASLVQLAIPAGNVVGNVIHSGYGSRGVPAGNTFVSSVAAIDFVDLSGGDLTLASTSPYRASGAGGTLPGADMTTVKQLTSGAVK